jgi:hypothetical protein
VTDIVPLPEWTKTHCHIPKGLVGMRFPPPFSSLRKVMSSIWGERPPIEVQAVKLSLIEVELSGRSSAMPAGWPGNFRVKGGIQRQVRGGVLRSRKD